MHLAGQDYFTQKRGPGPGGFNLNAPSTGLVVASSDVSTSVTLVAPTWAAGLTVTQLELNEKRRGDARTLAMPRALVQRFGG